MPLLHQQGEAAIRVSAIASAARAAGRIGRTCALHVVDLLLPSVCAICESRCEAGDQLCPECWTRLLGEVSKPWCPRCGSTLGEMVPARMDGCVSCPQPLPCFEQVVRLGPYAGPLGALIRACKFYRQERMLDRLAAMLTEAIAARLPNEFFDLIMPAPMHWRRRLSRGEDLARRLSASIAAGLKLPLGHELVRIRHTAQQARLPRTRRLTNVKGAFAVRGKSTIAGASIVLVDDVTTTGATADEASRTLLKAGASKVTLAVLAKVDPARAYASSGI
ncbi:MAG: ComF family protein [Planctomycetes bacterium]|nr:ComF family protein [Planctomycetota bacterium]